ncbi:netrin receptor UNC5C-like isoform X2 [Babylonia areolata]|uniref:netrin receptor UNC5C-like isoform X2 n=1 Tax=Babylonia areolata TaxID=304850 RepID=UPI003FD535AC
MERKGDFPFGSSDPLKQGTPEWLQQPEDNYYVLRNKPAIITCRATPAIQITFSCAGTTVPPKQTTSLELIDQVSGRKTLQSSVQVTRDEVEDYYGDDGYWCQCFAWNNVQGATNPQRVGSAKAHIQVAYLKKRFQRIPMSSRVAAQATVTLQCLPPEGKPLPTVFWLKDNVELKVHRDYNLIISSEGSLIINQARLQDSGNYTCGAVNLASRRLSDSATLLVYVDGGWSGWTEWSHCSVTCGEGKKSRTRICDHPAPLNGGKACAGPAQAFQDCTSLCPESRDMPSKTPVSRDKNQASHAEEDDNTLLYVGVCVAVIAIVVIFIALVILMRRRKNAQHQGVLDMDNEQDACQSLTEDEQITKNGDVMSMQPDVTQTSLQHLQQQQQQQQHRYNPSHNHGGPSFHHTNTSTSDNSLSARSAAGVVDAQGRVPLFDRSPSPLPPDPFYSSGVESDHLYSVPNAHLGSGTSSAGGGGERPGSRSGGGANNPYDTAKPGAVFVEEASQCSLGEDSQCYTEVDSQCYSEGGGGGGSQCNYMGGGPSCYMMAGGERCLSPPSAASARRLPDSEVRANNYLCSSSRDQQPGGNADLDSYLEKFIYKDSWGPNSWAVGSGCSDSVQDSRQSLVSVQLPSNMDTEAFTWSSFDHTGGRLILPESGVMVTVPEGALPAGQVQEMYMAVCRDDKDRPPLSDQQTILSPVVLVGPPGIRLVKPIILSFHHCASVRQGDWILSLYSSDAPVDQPPQWRRLAIVGQEATGCQVYTHLDLNHCHVMTEYLNRYALIGESVPGGKAVKIYRLAAFAPALPPSMEYSIRVYVVEDTQDALDGVVQVEQRLGGRLVDRPKQMAFQDGGHNLCLTLDDLSAGWRSKLPASYQEIPFRHIWSGNQNTLHCSFSLELVERDSGQLSCKIQVFQKGVMANRQVMHVSTSFTQGDPLRGGVGGGAPSLCGTTTTATTASSSGVSSLVTPHPPVYGSRLPSHTRSQLCQLLDPPSVRGNDWRMLAQALKLDRYVSYLDTQNSPTGGILDLWEARHGNRCSVSDLSTALRAMGRMDAAEVLEEDAGS